MHWEHSGLPSENAVLGAESDHSKYSVKTEHVDMHFNTETHASEVCKHDTKPLRPGNKKLIPAYMACIINISGI